MIQRYIKFSKKRIACFVFITIAILALQSYLTGSMVSRQKVVTEAGDANSAVIGILDDQEIIRQKFTFDRKVILSQFDLSFGAFEYDKVGTDLHIQIMDGDNVIVYDTTVPVSEITPNSVYTVKMNHTITIPQGVTCCLNLTCSAAKNTYAIIPTVNTTNRTDPNTYMSTLNSRTRKKALNISYTYYYRQIYPLVLLILEFVVLFVLCFERLTEYVPVYRKQHQKRMRRYAKNPSLKKRQKTVHPLKRFVKWCLVEPRVHQYCRRFIIIINPFILFLFLEVLNGTFSKMYPNIWIFSWILLGGIQLVLYALTGNANTAALIMNLTLFPAGLVNFFLMSVRGTPFLPADILGVTTATKVADHYTFSTTPAQFIVFPAFMLWCLLILRLKRKRKEYKLVYNIMRHLVPFAASLGIFLTLYYTPVLEKSGIWDSVWNKVSSCRTNGFYLNFFINLHYLRVAEPAGYSRQKVADILEDLEQGETMAPAEIPFSSNKDFQTNQTLQGKQPNIILIMNESLADFAAIGDVHYNRDPLEFMHSLKENTISGLDYVSIFGAGTSNSEFEAMTGNTMTFFPSGCNVFQQFMHKSTFSLPSYLGSMGYRCEAIHPSSGGNWNRINSYESMRFDQFFTIDDFKNPEYVRYISDKETYKKVIERFEAKKEGQPLFVFDLTIQNHGGYLTNTAWKDPVYVEGSYLAETKEFLSATKVSDDAFRYLIRYFQKVKEPTVICMFGDHHPSIENEFYESLLGKSQHDWELEDIQKRYATPFILWANYDIEEAENVVLSNNYLENLLLKEAGLELPLYNQFIEKVSTQIPAMNVNGYMAPDGTWKRYDTDEDDTVKKLLNDYKILQYGYYSDSDRNRMRELFQME